MILFFLLIVGADAKCRNGGILGGEKCNCVNGYTGNHCQINPPSMCKHGDSVVNLDSHVILNSSIIEKCTDYNSNVCYASPWSLTTSGPDVKEIEIDYTVQPNKYVRCENIQCQPNYSIMNRTCDDIGCDFNTVCCGENEQCINRVCALKEGYRVTYKNPETHSAGLLFTTEEHTENCCKKDESCAHSGFTCKRPKDEYCEDNCTSADFVEDGDVPSTCCEADSWYCDSGTCNNGFKTNTAFCGEKCDETHFTTTIDVSEVQAIAMTHGSVICEGEEQVGVDSSGCFEACNSFTNYFVIDDKCFCANNLGGQCTNNITDCSDWCPSGIVTQVYSSISSYFTTCEFSWDICPAGWFATATDWCRKQYESGTQLSSPDPCVASGTCCEPKLYDTYYISTDVIRTGSHCCDVDTSLIACMRKQCPDRYENKGNYATKLYSLDHTSECCNQIPDTHYCDAHNNGGDFACPDGKRLHYDDVFCGDHCSETQCCKPDNHFCDSDSLPCEGAEVPTGLDYCGKQCGSLQCCKAPPKCDISYDCKNSVSSSSRLDWNYVCTQLENGECASSEYALGKCCISDLSPYCYQDDRYDQSESVDVTRVSWDTPTHMGNPMPGCNEKEGYISYYEKYGRTGGSFTDESFEGVCCKYVETCQDDIMCPMIGGYQSFLKAGYSASVPRHCAAGSSSNWGRIQQCNNSSMASTCCEPETCAVAGARLTTSSCDEYSCDLCYETNNNFGSSYVDTGGGNYQWVPNKYFDVQLDKTAFQVNCCVPSCEQAKLETYDGGRGYKNGQPLCGTISGGWNTWKGHSYGGSETDGNFMEPSWIVDNCCYPSCGTEAVKQNYSCANFPIKSNYFSSDLIYGITLTAANFKETCCELPPPSCALSSLTQSCPTGFVERGLNNGVHGCKMDWEDKGIPCTASHQYQHWFSAPEYWQLPRDLTNFTQECCLEPGNNGYIDW